MIVLSSQPDRITQQLHDYIVWIELGLLIGQRDTTAVNIC